MLRLWAKALFVVAVLIGVGYTVTYTDNSRVQTSFDVPAFVFERPAPIIVPDLTTMPPALKQEVVPDDTKKHIAIIVSFLGLNKKVTQEALSVLPNNVTLAYSVHTNDLPHAVKEAKEQGFDVMLNLPMETDDFPLYDAGIKSIYATATPAQNAAVIADVLAEPLPITGFITQNTALMEKMPDFQALMQPVFDKGLAYVSVTTMDNPLHLATDKDVGYVVSPFSLDKDKQDIIKIARQKGTAVIVLPPVPLAIHKAAEWIAHADTDIQFVPIISLLEKQNAKAVSP